MPQGMARKLGRSYWAWLRQGMLQGVVRKLSRSYWAWLRQDMLQGVVRKLSRSYWAWLRQGMLRGVVRKLGRSYWAWLRQGMLQGINQGPVGHTGPREQQSRLHVEALGVIMGGRSCHTRSIIYAPGGGEVQGVMPPPPTTNFWVPGVMAARGRVGTEARISRP